MEEKAGAEVMAKKEVDASERMGEGDDGQRVDSARKEATAGSKRWYGRVSAMEARKEG